MRNKQLFALAFVTLTGAAQDGLVMRGDCTPDLTPTVAGRSQAPRRLPSINTQWDATKTYRQLVILLSFADNDFMMENPREVYDSMFNAKGYNQRQGKGSVADYYREQSGGLLNIQFDVYGPIKISSAAQPYDNPDKDTRNYGREQLMEATNKLIATQPDIDYSVYDWNGNGTINQVTYIFAGYCGNQSSTKCYGYIWPNTSSFSTIKTPDGRKISNYTCSGELWANNATCGIGTICHEFTHSLGLPDIYPTSSDAGYSVLDEWDLMDGGNFTNYGWCPPNFSALEKMLLGWLTPVELTEPATILHMKPVSQGGEIYQIKHTNNEYLLLENRQWEGWDNGLPGKGLAIFHVNYNHSSWSGNRVNATSKRGYSLVPADNMDYDQWESLVLARGVKSQSATYQNSNRMNRWMLSSAPYPWATDSTQFVNQEFTNQSVPPAKMYNANSKGEYLLSKTITHIRQNADGTVSFRFMGGVPIKGDTNDDDQVTTADIVAIVNAIALGRADTKADVNGDGRVDVADILTLQATLVRNALPVGQYKTKDCY